MGILTGKKALIMGIASKRSIAYGIAQAMHREGAEVALTYQGERLKTRVEEAAISFGSTHTFPLDVSKDKDIQQLAQDINEIWPDGLDIVVHSIAYAPREQLEGEYVDVIDREGFRVAHDISSYSLSALARALKPQLVKANGSILTLTYLGAERAVPNYNVMGVAKASLEANVRYLAQSLGPDGVRVNAISAGAIKTLAAAGIKGFGNMLKNYEQVTPMRKNVTIQDVGNTATFLASDWANGITGEVIHVDSGFHICGMALT